MAGRSIGKQASTMPRRGSRIVKKKRTTVVAVRSVLTRSFIRIMRAIVIMQILVSSDALTDNYSRPEWFCLHQAQSEHQRHSYLLFTLHLYLP